MQKLIKIYGVSIFTKRPRPAKMMLDMALSPLDNVRINKYTKFDPNIPCGSRVMSVYEHFH